MVANKQDLPGHASNSDLESILQLKEYFFVSIDQQTIAGEAIYCHRNDRNKGTECGGRFKVARKGT